MSATIVIPSTMRRDTVRPVVEAAVASVAGMEGGEVILVANGPADGRRRLDFRSPRLRVVECPVQRISAARNVGLRLARNEIVLFTDDDVLVSSEWAHRLTRRLLSGQSAVATPVDTHRDGPVTAFIDYQRIFHPPPMDATSVRLPIGASLAIRRDRVGFAFDDDLKSGDDVQFGSRLLDAGIPIGYERGAPPPLHLLPDRIEAVTARFSRYGSANAMVLLTRDRPQLSIPNALTMYSSLCRNDVATPRRFEEIADPCPRETFAALDLMLISSLLSGYLNEAGRILGTEIVSIDRQALADGWLEIEGRLNEDFGWDGDWDRLPLDFGRLLTPRATRAPRLAPAIADNLRRNAALTREDGHHPGLASGSEPISRRAEEVWRQTNEILDELRQGRLPAKEDAIASRLREDGIAFRDGLQTMETIALGAVDRETAESRD